VFGGDQAGRDAVDCFLDLESIHAGKRTTVTVPNSSLECS